jgi:methyl-accepting chemotaxis protein
MRWFENMRIRPKLVLTFSIVAALYLAVSAVGYIGLVLAKAPVGWIISLAALSVAAAAACVTLAFPVSGAVGKLIADTGMLGQALREGNFSVRADVKRHRGEYARTIEGLNGALDAVEAPLKDAVGVLDTMAANDFTRSMGGNYMGSFAALSKSVNSVLDTLNRMLGDINAAAEQVAAGTRQVSAGSQALSQGATEQASAIEQLNAAMEEIAGQTKQNAANAGQASELASAAKTDAEDGDARMGGLQQAMGEINEASGNISKVIKVIDEIAFQTNLLALNAAVEAARAGQHGRGFAVVAEEVRNLAQRSAGAARETASMIEESINKAKAGMKIANDTAASLNRIVDGVERANGLIGGIARASGDQAAAVAQVNKGIEQVSQVTQTNSATAEQSAAASEEMSSQAEMLKDMVGKFKLRGRAASGGSDSAHPYAQEAGYGKPRAGKPEISLSDAEFGKY